MAADDYHQKLFDALLYDREVACEDIDVVDVLKYGLQQNVVYIKQLEVTCKDLGRSLREHLELVKRFDIGKLVFVFHYSSIDVDAVKDVVASSTATELALEYRGWSEVSINVHDVLSMPIVKFELYNINVNHDGIPVESIVTHLVLGGSVTDEAQRILYSHMPHLRSLELAVDDPSCLMKAPDFLAQLEELQLEFGDGYDDTFVTDFAQIAVSLVNVRTLTLMPAVVTYSKAELRLLLTALAAMPSLKTLNLTLTYDNDDYEDESDSYFPPPPRSLTLAEVTVTLVRCECIELVLPTVLAWLSLTPMLSSLYIKGDMCNCHDSEERMSLSGFSALTELMITMHVRTALFTELIYNAATSGRLIALGLSGSFVLPYIPEIPGALRNLTLSGTVAQSTGDVLVTIKSPEHLKTLYLELDQCHTPADAQTAVHWLPRFEKVESVTLCAQLSSFNCALVEATRYAAQATCLDELSLIGSAPSDELFDALEPLVDNPRLKALAVEFREPLGSKFEERLFRLVSLNGRVTKVVANLTKAGADHLSVLLRQNARNIGARVH